MSKQENTIINHRMLELNIEDNDLKKLIVDIIKTCNEPTSPTFDYISSNIFNYAEKELLFKDYDTNEHVYMNCELDYSEKTRISRLLTELILDRIIFIDFTPSYIHKNELRFVCYK